MAREGERSPSPPSEPRRHQPAGGTAHFLLLQQTSVLPEKSSGYGLCVAVVRRRHQGQRESPDGGFWLRIRSLQGQGPFGRQSQSLSQVGVVSGFMADAHRS
jgi:hypothetical protein